MTPSSTAHTNPITSFQPAYPPPGPQTRIANQAPTPASNSMKPPTSIVLASGISGLRVASFLQQVICVQTRKSWMACHLKAFRKSAFVDVVVEDCAIPVSV